MTKLEKAATKPLSSGLFMVIFRKPGLWMLLFIGVWFNIAVCQAAGAQRDETGSNASAAGSPVFDNSVDISKDCHPTLLALLRQKNLEMKKRDEGLAKEQQDLDFLKQELDSKVKRLKDLQRSLNGPVKKKKYQQQARLQHLAGVYGSMDPARAASLLDKIDEQTVTKLFSIMKSKKVAPILAKMAPDKAARISAYLYRKPPSDL